MAKNPASAIAAATQESGAAETSVAAPVTKGTKTPVKVFVACKLPNGLELRLFREETINVPAPGGVQTIKQFVENHETGRVRLNGSASPFGSHPSFPVPAGYALTEVDSDFWQEWLRQNRETAMVKNRIVFSADTQNGATARALEQAKEKVRSGLEPIDRANPPVVGIRPAEKAAA